MVRRQFREGGRSRQGNQATQQRRWVRVLFLACVDVRGVFGQLGTGFCLDNIPPELEGTGFSAPSELSTQEDCHDAGYNWCPLSNETNAWNYTRYDGRWFWLEYYWFSSCCTGKQGNSLIVDTVTGLPTCGSTKSPYVCTRSDWQDKVLQDLVYTDYNFEVPPTGTMPGPFRAPSLNQTLASPAIPCLCDADSAQCVAKASDGSKCWICRASTPCSTERVRLGINFFKLHQIDLKTTGLTFKAWLRLDWNDYRLSYDRQCYGGIDYFQVQGDSGELENTRIWTPDLDLYNSEEPIWQGLASRLAIVYPCSSRGTPINHKFCGHIFWSRPGLLKALCKFEGLSMFPLDQLSCKIEFAAWTVDGRYQDIVKLGRGVEWTSEFDGQFDFHRGATPAFDTFGGITAGSNFQDYNIRNITCVRLVANYGGWPYPTLIYHISFSRATSYYVFRLVVPAVSLAVFSFITFWMNPEIGERLGFGITVILAMVANEVVASDMMPIASERVLMDYLSMGCQFFGWISLFETGVVLYLYHNLSDNWPDCLLPRFVFNSFVFLRDWVRRRSLKKTLRQRRGSQWLGTAGCSELGFEPQNEVNRIAGELADNKDRILRKQLYRQIFYTVDKDFSGTLSLCEIEEFGSFMMGARWDHDKACDFIRRLDRNEDGVLKLDEFAIFCEAYIHDEMDTRYIMKMVDGFLQVVERRRLTRIRMWQERAKSIDRFSRWSIPFGFFLFMTYLFTMDATAVHKMDNDTAGAAWTMSLGFLPAMILLAVSLLFTTLMPTTQKAIADLVDRFIMAEGMDEEHTNGRRSLNLFGLGKSNVARGGISRTAPEDLERAAAKLDAGSSKSVRSLSSVFSAPSMQDGSALESTFSGAAAGGGHADDSAAQGETSPRRIELGQAGEFARYPPAAGAGGTLESIHLGNPHQHHDQLEAAPSNSVGAAEECLMEAAPSNSVGAAEECLMQAAPSNSVGAAEECLMQAVDVERMSSEVPNSDSDSSDG